ncbi:MAG: chromate transporter [Clostridia bacterium]|nr:chromate transporter [Clostridia bacterium]
MIYLQLFFEFFKVGLFAVGGGMATFPFLTDLADKTGWYTQQQLIDMIAIAESTPGPIGVNTATYVGFATAGLPGALIASLGLITPSVIIILIIARVLARFKDSKLVQDVFYGLRPASTGLIAAAGFSVVLVALTGAQVDSLWELVGWQGTVHWPSILLAAVLLVLTRKVKQTKDLHPVVFIALSAVVGIVFGFAGV